MISFEVSSDPLAEAAVDLLAVGAFSADQEDQPLPGSAALALAEVLEVDLGAELASLSFDASVGSAARVPTRGRVSAPMVLVVGLGPREELTLARLRAAAAAAADASERLESVATSLHVDAQPLDPGSAATAVAEGVALGAYRFDGLKTDATPHRLARLVLHGDEVGDALAVARTTVDAVCLARDLVNLPPDRKRPPVLAERARDEVAELAVDVTVRDEEALAAEGYGGLLGVGAGSSTPPRLVELAWRPDGADRHIVLVGKGITFDSGGLSLKPSKSMEWMKVDMAGAAVVLATVRAVATLGLPVAVTGLMALAENMPGGSAIRPSDVLKSYSGTTIEVVNTDAEGRLVLADALARASELEPDVIVDAATLTGAAMTALGPRIGALMASDDDLAEGLLAAAARAGEPLWRLPTAAEEYAEDLEGDVADVRNTGWEGAGTIRAGLFLREFVGEGIPWAHLDIASVAWAGESRGFLRKGGTGVPVRTLVEWLRSGL